jgi:hypothetical protein
MAGTVMQDTHTPLRISFWAAYLASSQTPGISAVQFLNRRFYPFNAFRSLLGIAGGVKAPTYADFYSGKAKRPRF